MSVESLLNDLQENAKKIEDMRKIEGHLEGLMTGKAIVEELIDHYPNVSLQDLKDLSIYVDEEVAKKKKEFKEISSK